MNYQNRVRIPLLIMWTIISVQSVDLPGKCTSVQYYDPGLMACAACNANYSMVANPQSFSCECEPNSVPSEVARCRRCNATEVRSADGYSCIPRRCQEDKGRVACRKCPGDYISVTQNYDGSPMREVQCIKCARGYKAQDNRCVWCETCTCRKDQIIVRGRCLPRNFVLARPKYEAKTLHPDALLDIVKHEYLCMEGDHIACRALAGECIRNFYTTDKGGPCRLFLQTNVPRPAGLPKLYVDSTDDDGRNPGEVKLLPKQDNITLLLAVHASSGGLKFINVTDDVPCFIPRNIRIGFDFVIDCQVNATDLARTLGQDTIAPYLVSEGELQALPVAIRKPDGSLVQRGDWPSSNFRRYFVMDSSRSTIANTTVVVYLKTLLVSLSVHRDKNQPGHLGVLVALEAQYATKDPFSKDVTITITVENKLPNAGILRSLEIWGGVLAAFLCVYAAVQWRAAVRRGGPQLSLVPILAGCIADALYFAALLSTLHALAAEAGTLGLTLPLTKTEEYTVAAFVYCAVSLKIVKVLWLNWRQCTCDLFFLDWSEYNPPLKENYQLEKASKWGPLIVAREWSLLQTKRRVSPAFGVTFTLVLLHFISPWQATLPSSQAYKWVLISLAWWFSTVALYIARFLKDKLLGPGYVGLKRACEIAGVSILVFQEEFYAYYLHGRNDAALDARTLTGPLANCRVVCAPQLRVVYKQLTTGGFGASETYAAKRALLTRFLAAFFERALDGMSWVGSERSLAERLLDSELTAREAGSVLLYDDGDAPCCLAMTWWGEEWTLASFDAMLLGCVVVAGGDHMLASFVTLGVWQVSKQLRSWFGASNIRLKTEIVL